MEKLLPKSFMGLNKNRECFDFNFVDFNISGRIQSRQDPAQPGGLRMLVRHHRQPQRRKDRRRRSLRRLPHPALAAGRRKGGGRRKVAVRKGDAQLRQDSDAQGAAGALLGLVCSLLRRRTPPRVGH